MAEIQQYDVTDPDSPQYQQLQERIRSKEYTERWMNGTQLFELETINYVDVQEQTLSFHSKAEAERKEIIAAMKQFIQKSIQ